MLYFAFPGQTLSVHLSRRQSRSELVAIFLSVQRLHSRRASSRRKCSDSLVDTMYNNNVSQNMSRARLRWRFFSLRCRKFEKETVEAIEFNFVNFYKQRKNICVFCFSLAGMSRSVTVAVAYIMSTTNLSWKEALKVVRVGRSIANPNVGFQQQLKDFEASRLQEVSVEYKINKREVKRSISLRLCALKNYRVTIFHYVGTP